MSGKIELNHFKTCEYLVVFSLYITASFRFDTVTVIRHNI